MLLRQLLEESVLLWQKFVSSRPYVTETGWRTEMIYRLGPSRTSLDFGNFTLGQGLYDLDGSWVADVGLAWNYASWYLRAASTPGVTNAMSEPYANLQSLEVALRSRLRELNGPET